MAKRDYTKLTKAEQAWINETGRKVYKQQNGILVVKEECSRCGGCGRYSFCTAYLDTCFKCAGTGKQFSKVATVYNREKRLAREAAKREAAAEAFAQLMETHGWVSESDLYEAAASYKAKLAEKAAEAEKAAREADLENQKYVGEIGQRIALVVTVEKIIQIDTIWGTSWLHIMTGPEGENLTYFTSGDGLWDFQDGPVEIRGTVSKQEVYRPREHTGRPPVKQTQLKRVAVTKKAKLAYEAARAAEEAEEAQEEAALVS